MHMSSPCIFATIKDLPVNSTMYLVVFDATNICNVMKDEWILVFVIG